MGKIELISNNPLMVSMISILITAMVGGIGYLIKQTIKKENKELIKMQNGMVQNINTGINYKEAKEIAENVCDSKIEKLKEEIMKKNSK